jgi:hypothetical protein
MMSEHNRFDDDRDDHGHHHRYPFDQFFFDFDHFRHHHHDHLPPTLLDATLDASATDGNGHTLNGTGNPIDGWEIQNQGAFQLAADVHYRQGNTVQPVAATDDGLLVYSMPAGPQVADPAHGVPTANANRAATSFDWSFDTGVGPGTHQTIQQFLASGGEFIVKIDLDPSQHNNPLTLHAVYDPTINTGGSHVVWEDSHNSVVIADDGGNAYVTQNSQNYAFYQSIIDTDPHTPGIQVGPIGPSGIFDIEEQIVAPHHNVVADIHSVLQIGDAALQSDCHDLPMTLLNATVADNATDGNGHVLNGSGNPADGWEIQNNGSFQLATDVHYRQGDTVQPSAVTDNGTLIYNMPAGPQVVDAAHGVSTAAANRAATSFDWSFDTGVGSGTHQTIEQFLASGGQFIVKIDLDPSQNNNPLTLHAIYDPTINTGGSHVVWQDVHNNVIIGDDAGNAYVTQNSQNYAFYQAIIDTDPHTPGIQTGPVGPAGTFDIEEQIVAPHHDMIVDIHSILVLA